MFKRKLIFILFFLTSSIISGNNCSIEGLTQEETSYLLEKHPKETSWILSFIEGTSVKKSLMERAAAYNHQTVNTSLEKMGCYGMELISKIKTMEKVTAKKFFEKNKTSYPILANIFEQQSKKCLEQTKTKEEFDKCVKQFNAQQKDQNAHDVIWPKPDTQTNQLTLPEYFKKILQAEPIDLFYLVY